MQVKKITFCILILCFNLASFAQSYLTKYDYFIEPTLINPAIVGADYIPKATMLFNKQWLTINQSPYSFFLSGQMRLGKFDFYNPRMFVNKSKFKSLERVGIGAGLYSDVQGPFREINLLLTYSYHVPINNETNLSLGITGKMTQYGVNSSSLNPKDLNDPLINFNNSYNPNSNIGLYLYHKEYFAGLSLVNIFNSNENNLNYFKLTRNLYALGAYRFSNENKSILIEPMITFSYDFLNKRNQFDYHSKIYFMQYGWMGFSYINNKQMGVILAIKVKDQFYIAYKYSGSLGKTDIYGGGMHGIVIGKNLAVDRYFDSNN